MQAWCKASEICQAVTFGSRYAGLFITFGGGLAFYFGVRYLFGKVNKAFEDKEQ
jgi:hypothetical protein